MSLMDDPQQGVGARLRAERERVGLTQDEMGNRAGKNKQTQLRYENGLNSPTAAYLHDVAALGVDIGYVVTGFPTELHDDEALVLARFRAASAELRRAALSVLGVHPGPQAAGGNSITVGGSNSGQINGGQVNQSSVTFHAGAATAAAGKKKK